MASQGHHRQAHGSYRSMFTVRTGPSSYLFRTSVPPHRRGVPKHGALAQLGERLICIQEVRSSILLGSTTALRTAKMPSARQGIRRSRMSRERHTVADPGAFRFMHNHMSGRPSRQTFFESRLPGDEFLLCKNLWVGSSGG